MYKDKLLNWQPTSYGTLSVSDSNKQVIYTVVQEGLDAWTAYYKSQVVISQAPVSDVQVACEKHYAETVKSGTDIGTRLDAMEKRLAALEQSSENS